MWKVEKVVYAVRRRIGDVHGELPEEFRPAHLSVALVDAVFNPRLRYFSVVVPIVKRYCSHFGLVRATAPGEWPPALEVQETLDDLIGHYCEFGAERLRVEVFRSSHHSPGTHRPGPPVFKADNVLICARALRAIGVNALQDVRKMDPRIIKRKLCEARGIGPRTAYMLLMYAGNDDYVKGDVHICRFVADALGKGDVLPLDAERLVAGAARELGIAPRALDARIWSLRAGVGQL